MPDKGRTVLMEKSTFDGETLRMHFDEPQRFRETQNESFSISHNSSMFMEEEK